MNPLAPSGSRSTRRGFLQRAIGILMSAASISAFTPLLARSSTVVPDEADLEIAALGDWLLQAEPDLAAQLEAEARRASGLSAEQPVDWSAAQHARALLTKNTITAAELARDDVVFVDGWPLARSEAGAAILYSVASAHMQAGLGG
ncbi:MAG: hypothetical protein KDI17_15335 [Halioglobus sp.]|nr:hypothetical protein [Halioglobus sp.]